MLPAVVLAPHAVRTFGRFEAVGCGMRAAWVGYAQDPGAASAGGEESVAHPWVRFLLFLLVFNVSSVMGGVLVLDSVVWDRYCKSSSCGVRRKPSLFCSFFRWPRYYIRWHFCMSFFSHVLAETTFVAAQGRLLGGCLGFLVFFVWCCF
jgi:hypothetical protein